MWQGCFISFLGVSFVQFSETVQHHDKLDEFQLGFVKHGTESQGSCQIAFQAYPVSSFIVELVIPFNGMIAYMTKTIFWQDDEVLTKCQLLANALWESSHFKAEL